MDDQRVVVPNLQEMDEQEAHRFLAELLSNLDPQEEYNARHHEDYVMEMPQSGEGFRGRENLRTMQEAYPTTTPPSVRLRRVLVREGLWVAEGAIDYGEGRAFDVVLIFELRDGKMWRDRWYFAEPFEAPQWRARWVERMERWRSLDSSKLPRSSTRRCSQNTPSTR
jgi:SnoaL-like domain